MLDAFKPNTPAMYLQRACLDGPTIDKLLQPNGAVAIAAENFERSVLLAVSVEEGRVAEMIALHGDDDGRTLLKDEILRSLDERLTAILGL